MMETSQLWNSTFWSATRNKRLLLRDGRAERLASVDLLPAGNKTNKKKPMATIRPELEFPN